MYCRAVGRTPYTQQDKDLLARFLSTYPSHQHSKPTTFREGVNSGRLPNHSEQSWHSHFKDHREDIERRIEKIKRERAREKDKDKGKGKMKATNEEDTEESEDEPTVEKESKKRKNRPSTTSADDDDDESPKKKKPKKKRVPFDDKKDWRRLMIALGEAEKKKWQKKDIYVHLAKKYPDHTKDSWQSYHRDNRDEADNAAKRYLEQLESEDDDSEEEEEEEKDKEPSTKKKKVTQSSDSKLKADPIASTIHGKNGKKKKKEPTPVPPKKQQNDDGFDEPSPSVSGSDTSAPKSKPIKKPPPPPQVVASTSASTSTSTQARRLAPLPVSKPTTTKKTPHPSQIQNKRPQVLVLASSPPPPPPPPSARRPAPQQPSQLASPSTSKPLSTQTQNRPSVSSSSKPTQPRKPSIFLSTTSSRPRHRPVPPPPAPKPPSFIVATTTSAGQQLEPVTQSPRSTEKAASNLKKAVEVPLPPDEADDELDRISNGGGGGGDEYGDFENAEMNEEEKEDDEEKKRDQEEDDKRLVEELTRVEWMDWMDLTKQQAYECLAKLYPWYSAVEWEERYKLRTSSFLLQIAHSLAALEALEEVQLQPDDFETKVLEELTRCELLGIEKNPIVWENLAGMYRQLSKEEWKSKYEGTKRSVWQRRIAEKVRLAEEIKRRRMNRVNPKTSGTKKRDNAGAGERKRQREEREAEEIKRRRKEKGKYRARDEDDQDERMEEVQPTQPVVRASSGPSSTALQFIPHATTAPAKASTPTSTKSTPAQNRGSSRSVQPVSQASSTRPRASYGSHPNRAPPSLTSARLEPPTPPQAEAQAQAQLRSPSPVALKNPSSSFSPPRQPPQELEGPTTPLRSPSFTRPSPAPLSEAETVIHHSQYSVLPSPFKQESLFGQSESENEDEDDEEPGTEEGDGEFVEVGEGNGNGEQMKMEVDEPMMGKGPKRTDTAETTSSDRELVKQLEAAAAGKEVGEEIGEEWEIVGNGHEDKDEDEEMGRPELEVGQQGDQEEPEAQVPDLQLGFDVDSDSDSDSDFDPSNPFINLDPSEPPFSPSLTIGCQLIAQDHLKVLNRFKTLREREGENRAEEEQDLEGMTEMEREAEEWTRDEYEIARGMVANQVGEGTEVEEEMEVEKENARLEPVNEKVRDGRQGGGGVKAGKNRAASYVETDRLPTRKARKGTSISSEDVGAWRDQVEPGQSPPPPSSVRPPSVSPRIPRAALEASSSPRKSQPPVPVPTSTTIANVFVPAPTILNEVAPPAPTRQINPESNRNIYETLETIATELSLPFEVVDGVYWCACCPQNLDLFREVTRLYSSDRCPDEGTREWRIAKKKQLVVEWTYEDDKILLTGTEEEKKKLEKRKEWKQKKDGRERMNTRLEFLKRSGKASLEKLPRQKYVRPKKEEANE
ncbi:uncharacterized protein JCM6883_002886 [Sporobolomyces salmoneus]|uniref:uncharacterized protein n=1 Tax=Sporobolomyces salmoneus TaxID=183962 RepID=UPI00317E7887